MDDLAVFNGALTPGEIKQLYELKQGAAELRSRRISATHREAVTDTMRVGAAQTSAFYSPAKAIIGDDRIDTEATTRTEVSLRSRMLLRTPGTTSY